MRLCYIQCIERVGLLFTKRIKRILGFAYPSAALGVLDHG